MGQGAEPFLAIRRADRFSPNSVEKDRNILEAVCREVEAREGLTQPIWMVDEEDFARRPQLAGTYLSMARSTEALRVLAQCETARSRVVNRAQGVTLCQRTLLDRLMRDHGVPMPPLTGTHGYWLKRGDAAAQSKSDVVFCAGGQALAEAREAFRRRGIVQTVVSAHVPGDLIKFYGVGMSSGADAGRDRGERFFRYFYPSDDGISKFGDERHNGAAHHYSFDENRLRCEVTRLARLTGIEVYGGDAIIDEQGKIYLIDFNDWPSFSRCRDDAARSIASLVAGRP